MAINGPSNVSNVWVVTATPSTNGSETKTLNTAGTFLDKNIQIKTEVAKVGSPTLAITDAPNADVTVGTLASGYYPITASVEGTMSFASAGWMATSGAKATDTEATIGRMSAASFSTTSNASGLTITATAGYVPAGDIDSVDVSAATIQSGAATIDSATYTYNSTNDNFGVTGSATVAAPTVPSAGYVSSSIGTKNTNTATLSTSVAKIAGSTTFSGTGINLFTPTITRSAVDISGVTDAADGSATTTAPSSGVYVKVSSAKNAGNITATPAVTTAGYGTSTYHGIAGATREVGAAASAATYVKIKTGSASTPATSITANPSIGSAASNKYTISVSATKSVTPTVSAGWVASGTAGDVTVSGSLDMNQSSLKVDSNETSYGTSATITPGTTNASHTVTIGAGYYHTARTITVDAMTTTSASRNGNTVSWGTGYITAGSSTGATTSVTQGTTTVSGTTATRGTASWGTGWITSSSIAAATFANVDTSGVTYVDISNTTAAPILTSDGYLYINKGYVDNLKISLAKLIPDEANVTASSQLLSGYSAYDKDGKLITGNVATLSPAATYYTSTNTGYGKLDAGYLASTTYIVAGSIGTVSGGGLTVNEPSVTDGDDYLGGTSSAGYAITLKSSGSRAATTQTFTKGWINTAPSQLASDSKEASKTFYITKGSLTTNSADVAVVTTDGANAGTNISASIGTKVTTEPTSGYYAAFEGSGSSKVATAGWIEAGKTSDNAATATRYFPITSAAATVSASGEQGAITIAEQSTAVSGKTRIASTPTTASTGISKYFLEVNATAAATTITLSKSGLTAGYIGDLSQITANNKSLDAKSSSTYYLPIATGALSVSGSATATPSAAASGFTASTTETAYYVTSSASGSYSASVGLTTAGYVGSGEIPSAASGSATAGTAVKTYIPVGQLSAGSTTITPNSFLTLSTTDTTGVSISASGSVSVGTAGYLPTTTTAVSSTSATKYVTGVKIAAPASGTRSFTITVPNGSTTEFINFVFTVDASGNVTVAES